MLYNHENPRLCITFLRIMKTSAFGGTSFQKRQMRFSSYVRCVSSYAPSPRPVHIPRVHTHSTSSKYKNIYNYPVLEITIVRAPHGRAWLQTAATRILSEIKTKGRGDKDDVLLHSAISWIGSAPFKWFLRILKKF